MRGIDKNRRRCLVICICLLCLPLFSNAQTVHARFRSGTNIVWPIPFEDQYLAVDGRQYYQPLARASLGMALSAFRAPGQDIAQRGQNIRQYLQELGFEHLSLQQYDVEPGIQTIASAIGLRQITQANQTMPVVAVAISGGGYKDEWKSNFSIGDGLHHQGFEHAARLVYARLSDYIQRRGLAARPFKIWISGYSRAAATANLAAAMMIDRQLVEPQNLYAYTFATPNVTRQKNAASYPSIFNIVGAFDPVPMIPFADWGFSRFGSTYYLPAPETNSDYAARSLAVREIYRLLAGGEFWTNASGNTTVLKLLGTLSASVATTGDYSKLYQPLLIRLWNNRNNPLKMLASTFASAVRSGELGRSLGGVLNSFWTIFSNSVTERLLQEDGLFKKEWNSEVGLLDNLVHEHQPKGYLAWLSAFSDLDSMASPNQKYRQILLNNFASVQVYNQAGTLVCAFSLLLSPEGAAAAAPQGLPLTQMGDETVITVPADEQYTVAVTVSPEDSLSFAIKEGQVGHTRMASFRTRTQPAAQAATWRCVLDAGFSAAPAYTVTTQGKQLPLAPLGDGAGGNQFEVNSGTQMFFSRNLVVIITVLASIALQLLFYLLVAVRALRRLRYRWRHRKLKLPAPSAASGRRLFCVANGVCKNVLQALAAALALLALATIGFAMKLGIAWLQDIQTMQSRAFVWFTTLFYVPLFMLMLFAALPACFGAGFALLWRRDLYTLKTARLFILSALPFTGVLAYYLTFDMYAQQYKWLTAGVWAQALLAGTLLIIIHKALRDGKIAPTKTGAGSSALRQG